MVETEYRCGTCGATTLVLQARMQGWEVTCSKGHPLTPIPGETYSLGADDEWKELAASLLLAPYLGEIAPYYRTQACIKLDHPRTPKGHCVCGKMKAPSDDPGPIGTA